MDIERRKLKKAYARLIAKEIQETLEPKDIIYIHNEKKCIRNKLMEYDINMQKNIYKEKGRLL